jgi:hypothetical protein
VPAHPDRVRPNNDDKPMPARDMPEKNAPEKNAPERPGPSETPSPQELPVSAGRIAHSCLSAPDSKHFCHGWVRAIPCRTAVAAGARPRRASEPREGASPMRSAIFTLL